MAINKKVLLLGAAAGLAWYFLSKSKRESYFIDFDAGSVGGFEKAAFLVGGVINEAGALVDFGDNMNSKMSVSADYLGLLMQAENGIKKGYKNGKWYIHDDGAGYPTIAYGHKVKAGENFKNGLTDDEAVNLLIDDLQFFMKPAKSLKVKLTQGQFDAVTDFCYNCGNGNFEAVLGSSARRWGVNPKKAFNEIGVTAGVEQMVLYYSKLVNQSSKAHLRAGWIKRSQLQQNMAGRDDYSY